MERLTLTVEEAGRLLGLGRSASYEAARRGQIPTLRFGRRVLVPKAQLDALLAGNWPTGAKTEAQAAKPGPQTTITSAAASREGT
jgi:excisionase family DNA binding protein